MKNIHEMSKEYVETNHSPSSTSDLQAAMNIAVAKSYTAGANYVLSVMEDLIDNFRYPEVAHMTDKVEETILRLKGELTEVPEEPKHSPFFDYMKTLDTPETYEKWRLTYDVAERYMRDGKDPDDHLEEIKQEVSAAMAKWKEKSK